MGASRYEKLKNRVPCISRNAPFGKAADSHRSYRRTCNGGYAVCEYLVYIKNYRFA